MCMLMQPSIINYFLFYRLEKIAPLCRMVEADLPAYRRSGRLMEEDVEWWRQYLDGLQGENQHRPDTPKLSCLPVYTDHQRPRQSVIPTILREALNNSINRLQHVSEIRLSRQRIVL